MAEQKGTKGRIGIGGFWHETNSFSPWLTELEAFSSPTGAVLRADEIAERLTVDCPIAGFFSRSEQLGYSPVPVVDAYATPSGTISREAYESISKELVDGLLAVHPVEALLVSLHGAAVAEGCLDPEGDIVVRLRERRQRSPIGVVLDHHAGVSEELVAAADLIIGYKTEPHVDTAACGEKVAQVIARILEGEISRIDSCVVRIPVLLPIENLLTTTGPLAPIMARATELEERHGKAVIDISVFPGFAYSDSPATGSSILVQTDADPELAKEVACDLADEFWSRRSEFLISLLSPREAVERVVQSSETPVVLVDKADHPGAGGVGDASLLLTLLVEHGASGAVVVPIHDPRSVELAVATGVGGSARFRIGGILTGEPFEATAVVRLLSDGRYQALGPVDHGAHLSAGRTAVLEIGDLEVVVCDGRSGLNDPEMLRRVGIEPTRRRILCIKGLGTFRAAFGSIIGEVLMVDGEGAAPQDLAGLPYRHVRRPIEPLDPDLEFDARASALVVRGREW